ncbi:hypothetical protein E5161_01615 [Cohnella pontilimi]|uniref:beta-galactosidase n=1 Tax=Cohnella pontilimi TaxID=2564100 RepID=A0A4U0FKN1_9BACL|nr:beta-galactosidase [Cohnella pontilimi]TJY44122.1 hypothetical protein E5161_01615 [Cohnella pontilimi]
MAEKTYDIDYSTRVETGHSDKLKSFLNADMKVFFVPSVHYGREVVELIQRTGLGYDTVTYDRAWDLNKWGIGDFYDIRAAIGDFRVILANLERLLTSDEHFDALVIPGINGWSYFTEPTRQAILRRVEAGAGLVLVKPFHGSGMEKAEELELLSPLINRFEEGFGEDSNAGGGYPRIAFELLKTSNWKPEKHYITDGIPFEIFPYQEIAYYPYDSSGEVIIRSESGDPIAAVKEYGKGRVAAFGYNPRDILPQHSAFTGKESTYDAIIDGWSGAKHSGSFPYLEYFYELLYRSIIWTTRRTPERLIAEAAVTGGKVTIEPSENTGLSIRYTIKDLYDSVMAEGEVSSNSFTLPEACALGGSYRVELSLMDGDCLSDWATVPVQYPLTASIAAVSVGADSIRAGDTLEAEVYVTGAKSECKLSVVDDFERIAAQQWFSVDGETRLPFSYTATHVKSLHVRVRVELFVDGHMIHRVESQPVVVTPAKRSLDDFEVFMSPQNRGQGEWLPLVGQLFREMGVTGLFPGSSKTLTMSGARGLGVYWYHRHAYVQRKESYWRTKDKLFLHRIPCLNDPEFWSEMQVRITETIRKYRKYGPVSYFANDEGSLTCYVDELDLCFCPHCMKEMRTWLREQYEDLNELNGVWGTGFTGWEDVVPYTLEEAQNSGRFAPWGDHRRFMEHTFAEAYRKILAFIREADPSGVIRMSGCQASTAYSGYDYYQLHRHVGYFEAYGVGNQFEFHRSFANPGTIIGGWFGYGAEGKAVQNRIWNAVYHNLTLISIFWEYSCLNPDFTFSRSARDMSEAFLEIKREGIGKLLLYGAQRDSLGIAVHYSMPSIHGSRIKEDTTRFESNRQGWIDVLEDLGFQYNFVATQQIEAGDLIADGYRLLILPYSIALSDREAEEIKRFANHGGLVVGDFQTGIMDEHCVQSEMGKLDDLFGIERLSTKAGPFYINEGFCTNADFPYFEFNLAHIPGREDEDSDLKMAEFGTRAKEGKAAYFDDFMRTVASVVVREYGRGKGVYLNLAVDRYPALRSRGGFALRELLKHVLGLAGVEKPSSLKRADGSPVEQGYESVYYRDGDVRYVCIQSRLEEQALGHDGLAVGAGRDSVERSETLTVEFAAAGNVYDVRRKTYLGYTNSIRTEITAGDTCIFAVLPYRVTGIELGVPHTINRGQTVDTFIRIASDHPEENHRHVISVNVYNPLGEYEWIYSENRAVTGDECYITLAIPFNETTGKWKIRVKDVATGVTAESEYEIV